MINIDFTITCGKLYSTSAILVKECNNVCETCAKRKKLCFLVYHHLFLIISVKSMFLCSTINFCLHLQLRSILPLLFRQVVYSIDHHIELMLYDMIFEN
jgi:hypothetical protein